MQARHGGLCLIGVPVDGLVLNEVLERIEAYIASGNFHQIATANVNFLVNSIRSPELHHVLGGCDMVVPDGMPLLWFSRWMNLPLPERVPGVDLIPHLAHLSASRGYRIFFLGSSEASSNGAATNLRERFPGVQIVGQCYPPWRPIDDMDNDMILAQIEEAAPDILLVGFGNPKQELWMARLRHRLRVPVCIGIGGSLDMIAGTVKRSPEKYQRWGLEWFYRVLQEPRRLLGRYVSDFFLLLKPLCAELLTLKLQGKRKELGAILTEYRPGLDVVFLQGGLSDLDLEKVCSYAEAAVRSGNHLVLDLEGVHYLGADAISWLIRMGFDLKESGSELWLTSPRPAVMRVLRAFRLNELIQIEQDRKHAFEVAERIARGKLSSNYDDGNDLRLPPLASISQRGCK